MKKAKIILAVILVAVMICAMFGCSKTSSTSTTSSDEGFTLELVSETINKDDIFSNRDLTGDYLDTVENITLSNEDVSITEEGIYILTGTLTNNSITINTGDDEKVQLVLNGVSITNSDNAGIIVENADKVFITTQAGTTNTIETTGQFSDDTIDGAIYSKDDLTFNGEGSLVINSTNGHGVVCNDDLKICSGEINITAGSDALKSNDSIAIADGTLNLTAGEDAIHSDNDEDTTKGTIYIEDCNITISAGDDGIHGGYYDIIEGGTIDIQKSYEGIEAQKIEINGGTINVVSSDDGLNASSGSTSTETNGMMPSSNTENSDSNIIDLASTATSDSSNDSAPTPPDGETPSMPNGEAPSGDMQNGDMPSGEAPSGDMQNNDAQANMQSGGNRGNGNMQGGGMDTDEDCYVNIAGGTLTVNASGDGLDSNGYLQQTGGNVVVYGPEDSGNGAIDYGISSKITGGTIVAFGSSGMAEGYEEYSTQCSMLIVFDSTTNEAFTLKTSSGDEIISQTSSKSYNSVVVSTPDIKEGETYTASAGSEEKEIDMDSIVYTDTAGSTMGGGFNGDNGMNKGAKEFNRAKEESTTESSNEA